MRHRKSGLKLNRTASHRAAMFRNMVTSLFKHQRIQTTDAKARELRRWADHLISLAKRGDLHARRQALAIVREKNVVHKLFEEAASRFDATAGGYTRVAKLGRRVGDGAPVSVVELVTAAGGSGKTKKKTVVTPKAAALERKAVTEAQPTTVPEGGPGPVDDGVSSGTPAAQESAPGSSDAAAGAESEMAAGPQADEKPAEPASADERDEHDTEKK
jgi:large subunit ribosomal protein L17